MTYTTTHTQTIDGATYEINVCAENVVYPANFRVFDADCVADGISIADAIVSIVRCPTTAMALAKFTAAVETAKADAAFYDAANY